MKKDWITLRLKDIHSSIWGLDTLSQWIMILISDPRFVYPSGKPIIPHLQRYAGFAVAYYGFTLEALDLGHPRLSLN